MVWYATREDVKDALDVKETARSNARVDRALEGASRAVEGLLHREFAPVIATRYFDWPNSQTARPWRLWLDDSELISVTSLSSGGVTIAASDFFLEPNRTGPPYRRIEIDLDSNAAYGGGATYQRDITITGLWGYANDETPAGTVAEALDASETAVDVDGAASALLGVGSVLRVDSERMLVTGRSQLNTGQSLGGDLTASAANTTVAVADGTAFAVDEVLLVDGERMRIEDTAGNQLVVKRAWDGSVLAAHTAGTNVFAARTLTVSRGALGTTAATHTSGTVVNRWDPPGPVRDLCIAEALTTLLQGQSGYARVVGSGENQREAAGKGLGDLRCSVYASHGRKARTRAV
ncbi:hypothetical protein ACH4TQ_27610 [Streptomyces sp. NPDC021218]|uniref:hypothetical protein n=1 Tax=Streptomyces sp. NPDC021218 TaxID=3365119 RepID=UPI0037AB71A7